MKVAFRTDASGRIGTGHLMRCLTLADALRAAGARARFVCRDLARELGELVLARGHELVELPRGSAPAVPAVPRPEDGHANEAPAASRAHAHWLGTTEDRDAAATLAALSGDGPWDWLVVDHYALGAQWETRLRACASRILAIDDLADRPHDCDALLDQNLYAGMHARYDGLVPDGCIRLLGPRHALLRPEFAAARDRLRTRGDEVRRVLVFYGGVDAANLTTRALDALDAIAAEVDVDVVIGATHPDRDAIVARCGRRARTTCHVQASDMAGLIADADVGIGAAGVATWERCALGLPALAVAVAANQRVLLRDAARAGLVLGPDIDPADTGALALHLRALLGNAALRAHLSRQGLDAVDALGAGRVARLMSRPEVTVRPATDADSDDLLAWRNAPEVRRFSRSDRPIDRDEHRRWMTATLAAPDRLLLIGQTGGVPVGVVRYDVSGDRAEVSIYLAPGRAGRGIGGALLAAAERWLSVRRPEVETVVAEVIADNVASQRLFTGCGFEKLACRYRKRIRP